MPIVLLTSDRRHLEGYKDDPKVRPHRPELFLSDSYAAAARGAGATPLLVPPGPADLDALFAMADGFVLTGGYFDIHPHHYGQDVTARLDRVEEDRTGLELALARRCLSEDIPVLGICGGMQLLAVAAGGTLVQHLEGPPHTLEHEQPTDPGTPWHDVRCEGEVAKLLGTTVPANSTHHQAVADPGSFTASGWTEDGCIEAMELRGHRYALGVQWHPELLGDLRLYRALIA